MEILHNIHPGPFDPYMSGLINVPNIAQYISYIISMLSSLNSLFLNCIFCPKILIYLATIMRKIAILISVSFFHPF